MLIVAAAWSATTAAQQPKPTGVKIVYVLPVTATFPADALSEIAFSVRNDSGRTLEWFQIRLIVRNPRREVIQEQLWEVDLVKFMRGSLMPSGAVKQFAYPMTTRGYRTSNGEGSVEVLLTDFRLRD